jgi:hypothetical protein
LSALRRWGGVVAEKITHYKEEQETPITIATSGLPSLSVLKYCHLNTNK